MRRAARVEVLRDDEGAAWGVILASAACAEHEWGVAPLAASLGLLPVRRGNVGVAARRMRGGASPDIVRWDDGDVVPVDPHPPRRRARSAVAAVPWASLTVTSRARADGRPHVPDPGAAHAALAPDRAVAADGCWDGSGFRIDGYGRDAPAIVAMVSDAFASGDLALWVNRPSHLSETFGLVLAAASRVPVDALAIVERADLDGIALAEAVSACGIVERVAAAKGRTFSLSPRWIRDRPWAPSPPSAHAVTFWLSAADEGTCVEGWYTAEQLDEWITGRGPAHVEGARPGPTSRFLQVLDVMVGGRRCPDGDAAPPRP